MPIDSGVLAAQPASAVDYPCDRNRTGISSKFWDLGSASRDPAALQAKKLFNADVLSEFEQRIEMLLLAQRLAIDFNFER